MAVNKKIKVSESYVQKLRDAGTKKAALAKYGKSTDPQMREALRRFYGANAIAPMSDSARAKASTLPRKSVATKPKTVTTGSRTSGKITVAAKATETKSKGSNKAYTTQAQSRKQAMANMTPVQRKRNDQLTKFGKDVLYPVATTILPVTKGGLAAKAVYSAAAKRAGVPAIKAGIKKGISDKRELSSARSMARGMIKDDIKLKSKTAKLKATNTAKNTAGYYGSAAKNEIAGRTGRSMTMRSTQQAVATAAKKKATSLKRAETTRVKKETSGMMGTAKIDKAKAAAKRASKAGK